MRVTIGKYPKSEKQRIERVQIDPWDTWSLDHTLALIIAPALRQMSEDRVGIPGSLVDMAYTDLEWDSQARKDAEGIATEQGAKKWGEIMDKMIYAFEQVAAEFPDEPDITKDKSEWTAYQAKIDEGLRLFGEWYRALWT